MFLDILAGICFTVVVALVTLLVKLFKGSKEVANAIDTEVKRIIDYQQAQERRKKEGSEVTLTVQDADINAVYSKIMQTMQDKKEEQQ